MSGRIFSPAKVRWQRIANYRLLLADDRFALMWESAVGLIESFKRPAQFGQQQTQDCAFQFASKRVFLCRCNGRPMPF